MNNNFYDLKENWSSVKSKIETMSAREYGTSWTTDQKFVELKAMNPPQPEMVVQSPQPLPHQETAAQRIETMLQDVTSRLGRLEEHTTKPPQVVVQMPHKMVQILQGIYSRLEKLENHTNKFPEVVVEMPQDFQRIVQGINSRLESLENHILSAHSKAVVDTHPEIGKILQTINSRLESLEQHIVTDVYSDPPIEPSAEGGGIISKFFGSSTPRKTESAGKRNQQERARTNEKDKQLIKELQTQLKSYEQLHAENQSQIRKLGKEVEQYKQECERMKLEVKEANKAKKRAQEFFMEERGFQDGHHDRRSGSKKPTDVSSEYDTLFTNKSFTLLRHLKKKDCQIAEGELKILPCNVFRVAFDICKSKHLNAMFEELFQSQSHDEDSLERAKEQARMYGRLSTREVLMSPDRVTDDVIKQIKVALPHLQPALSEEPMLAFIKEATTTAINMVTMHPPMFIACPPATVRSFNSAIHEEKGWSSCEHPVDDTPLIYLRPMLYTSYSSDHPELAGVVALQTSRKSKRGQAGKTAKAAKATYIGGDDDDSDL